MPSGGDERDRERRAVLLEHYRNPHKCGHLEHPDFCFSHRNHACGDSVSIEVHMRGDFLADIAFVGAGCVLSQATASLMMDACTNMNLEHVLTLDKKFVEDLVGMPLGPVRLQCALLCLQALQEGIRAYKMVRGNANGGTRA